MAPRDAIYQACLLRFRPILMTTMAALLGALPLMLGTGRRLRTAPSAGHRHGRRPDGEPGADVVHHAGDLSRIRPARRTTRRTRGTCRTSEKRPRWTAPAMNLSAPFIVRPVATTLLTRRRARRRVRFRAVAGCAVAAGGFPDDLGFGQRCPVPARKQWRPRWPRRWSAHWAASPASRR